MQDVDVFNAEVFWVAVEVFAGAGVFIVAVLVFAASRIIHVISAIFHAAVRKLLLCLFFISLK